MRLNRGTITLLVGSALVILAVLLFNSVATAPGAATPTATGSAGPLFEGLEGDTIDWLEIASNINGEHTTMLRDAGGAWSFTEVSYATDRAVDQDVVNQVMDDFAGLEANDSFVAEDLAPFGLDQPEFIVTAQAGETAYTIYVGLQNPTGNRYYVLVSTGEAEALVLPTAVPTEEATVEATEETEAEATEEATEDTESAEEADAEPTEEAAEATEEADAEPTEEAAEEAAVEGEATEEATEEAAVEGEATEEATEEAEPTYTPLTFVNEGQTVYLVNKTTLDDILNMIVTPPYVPAPTSTPTPYPTANPYSEVQQTATAAVEHTATAEFGGTATADFEATLTATAQPTEQLASTVEITAEAEEATPTPTPTPQ